MGLGSESTYSAAQLRAARALLGFTLAELAEETQLGERTLRRAEREDGPSHITPANLAVLVSVLTKHGVEFLFPDGVRLRKGKGVGQPMPDSHPRFSRNRR